MNPEQTKNFRASVVHFFNIGQYNILILIQGSVTSLKLQFGDVLNTVCFDMPWTWNIYKEAADLVEFDNGSVLTLEYGSEAP